MSRDAIRTSLALLAAVYLAAGAGCGPKHPQTAPVSGRVTYQGRPLTTGRIAFQPEQGRPAIGDIGPDGTYRLTTFEPGDGALPGHYRVTVESMRVTGTVAPPPKSLAEEGRSKSRQGRHAVEWLAPEKYARLPSTPLTAEVKPGPNSINFDLP